MRKSAYARQRRACACRDGDASAYVDTHIVVCGHIREAEAGMRMSGRISEPVCADEASHGDTEETRFRSPANLDVTYMYEIYACAYGYMCVVNMCALRNMCSHTRFRFRSPANLYVSYIYICMLSRSLSLNMQGPAGQSYSRSLARSLSQEACLPTL